MSQVIPTAGIYYLCYSDDQTVYFAQDSQVTIQVIGSTLIHFPKTKSSPKFKNFK